MNNDTPNLNKSLKDLPSPSTPDEQSAVMIYGNLKIRDVETNEILINKRF